MAKINGTSFLLYSNGTLIAAQKSCTVSWEQDLPDATTKDGAGWAEHILGSRSATCDFDCLVSTTGLSASGLYDLIISRKNLVLAIDGMGVPIVGEADLKNISINAPTEDAAGLSGQFIFKGGAWLLTGDNINLVTDPDGGGHTYDTMTVSGLAISSAINNAGTAGVLSNTMSISTGSTYKVITYLTSNSGELPSVYIDGSGAKSNSAQLVAGVNVITLVATGTGTYNLYFYNSAAANWSTTNIYCFKV